MSTKITWADITLNPVWGCENECWYCYARNFAKRFCEPTAEREATCLGGGKVTRDHNLSDLKESLSKFEPTWLQHGYNRHLPVKQRKRVFVNSMSDIYYWKPEWLSKVMKLIRSYPQHVFIFLTKHPEIYEIVSFPSNCVCGITVTSRQELFEARRINRWLLINNIALLNIEPIMEKDLIKVDDDLSIFDWMVIGSLNTVKLKNDFDDTNTIIRAIGAARFNKIPVYVKQVKINGVMYKDVTKFPKAALRFQEYPIAICVHDTDNYIGKK